MVPGNAEMQNANLFSDEAIDCRAGMVFCFRAKGARQSLNIIHRR
jgi:hypothetical protein